MNAMNRGLAISVSLNLRMPIMHLEKFFYYLVTCFGFVGVACFPIDLGILTLFPFRILLLALWALFVTRALVQKKITVPVAAFKSYVLFLNLWVVYAVMSLVWAASKADAIRHIAFLFMGVSVISFAVYYLRTREDLKRLYWIWISVFFALVLLGLWEHLTGQHLPVSGYSEQKLSYLTPYVATLVRRVPTGVFNNPNDYATLLTLSIPFALGLMRYARRQLTRLLGLFSALVAFYLIVVTGSRANILAVLLEVAFLILLLTNLKQKIKVAVFAMVCLAVALFFLPDPVQKIFSEVSRQLGSIAVQAELGTDSVTIRANLVRNGLLFLFSTAGFGVGAGNAEYWMANFARYDTAGILNPHNWWLEILINYGIFIFFGYAAMYLGILRRLWLHWHRSKDRLERMIAEALLVSLVGFTIASVSPSSIMALHPQWLLFAFVLTFLSPCRR